MGQVSDSRRKPDKETRAWIQTLSKTAGNTDGDDTESL